MPKKNKQPIQIGHLEGLIRQAFECWNINMVMLEVARQLEREGDRLETACILPAGQKVILRLAAARLREGAKDLK